jgi:hypothetical protein
MEGYVTPTSGLPEETPVAAAFVFAAAKSYKMPLPHHADPG